MNTQSTFGQMKTYEDSDPRSLGETSFDLEEYDLFPEIEEQEIPTHSTSEETLTPATPTTPTPAQREPSIEQPTGATNLDTRKPTIIVPGILKRTNTGEEMIIKLELQEEEGEWDNG